MNILLSDWLPVYLKDGQRVKIAPYDIARDQKGNPAVSLAFNRPDLDATVVEMLIGMLQTFYCPDERVKGMDWTYIYSNPPDSDKLRTAFEKKFADHFIAHGDDDLQTRKVSEFFNLLDGEFRFMQDKSLSAETTVISPGELLIDLDAVQSHFAKRQIKALCRSCMTAALYTLQARANSGGSGHMQSIRGGNAFTTIVKGGTLWETCWLNILGRNTVRKYGEPQQHKPGDIFPWLRKSGSIKGLKLKAEEVSLLHCYWQMPRRIYLKSVNSGSCMLCNEEDTCVTEVVSSSKGIQYVGENRFHPLAPLIEKKDEKNNDKIHYELYEHNEYGSRYKHWLALTRTEPAPTVAAAMKRNQARKLWAFGYVCKNKLALAWDEGEFTFISLTDKIEEKDAENVIRQLIDIASKAAEDLQLSAGKAAALISKRDKGRKVKFPATDKEPLSTRFWQVSEQDFYSNVTKLQSVFSGDMALEGLLVDWGRRVKFHALNVFDSLIDFDAFNTETMSIVAERRADLSKSLNKLYKTRKEGKGENNKVQKG